jgi:hypothetical protein
VGVHRGLQSPDPQGHGLGSPAAPQKTHSSKRCAANEIAADLRKTSRQLYVGSSRNLWENAKLRDFVSVQPGHFYNDGGLIGASGLARALGRYLVVLSNRAPYYMRVRDMDQISAKEHARKGANLLAETVEALALDVSAADLSGMKTCEPSLLTNVIWTVRTTWPPTMTDLIRAQSRPVKPGVFQVTSR